MNINRLKDNAKNLFNSQLFWIRVCAIGICLLVFQNYFGGEDTAQRVYVVGGQVDAHVRGSVDIDNTVDVNLEAVNGYRNAFYGPSNDGSYDAIHVYTGK